MSSDRLRKKDRHELMLNEVRNSAAIRVSQLAKRIGVTGETVRRDLAELGAAALIGACRGTPDRVRGRPFSHMRMGEG